MPSLASPPADLQPGGTIHRVHALVIGDDPVTTDQGMQASISKARALGRMRLESREQSTIVDASATFVPPRGAAQTDHSAGSPFTGAARLGQPPHHLALRDGAYHFFATTAFSA